MKLFRKAVKPIVSPPESMQLEKIITTKHWLIRNTLTKPYKKSVDIRKYPPLLRAFFGVDDPMVSEISTTLPLSYIHTQNGNAKLITSPESLYLPLPTYAEEPDYCEDPEKQVVIWCVSSNKHKVFFDSEAQAQEFIEIYPSFDAYFSSRYYKKSFMLSIPKEKLWCYEMELKLYELSQTTLKCQVDSVTDTILPLKFSKDSIWMMVKFPPQITMNDLETYFRSTIKEHMDSLECDVEKEKLEKDMPVEPTPVPKKTSFYQSLFGCCGSNAQETNDVVTPTMQYL